MISKRVGIVESIVSQTETLDDIRVNINGKYKGHIIIPKYLEL